jgi:transposase
MRPVIERAVATLVGSRRRRIRPRKMAGDKGYSSRKNRDWLKGQRIKPVIPHKDNEKARHDGRVKFDKPAYRGRAVIEQCVGWLKENRRIATRFEKLAINFVTMLQLAMIKRYLRLLFSDRA